MRMVVLLISRRGVLNKLKITTNPLYAGYFEKKMS